MVRKIKGQPSAVFLHIPRTGGSFIEKALQECTVRTSRWTKNKAVGNVPRKHVTKDLLNPEAIKKIDHYFAFVRDPITYYPSVWMWLKRSVSEKIFNWDWHPLGDPASVWDDDFNEWARRMAEEKPAWAFRLFEKYCGTEENPICSFVGRTERIEKDFCSFCSDVLGYDTRYWPMILAEMGRKNVARSHRPGWEADALDAVYASEADFYRRWGGLDALA